METNWKLNLKNWVRNYRGIAIESYGLVKLFPPWLPISRHITSKVLFSIGFVMKNFVNNNSKLIANLGKFVLIKILIADLHLSSFWQVWDQGISTD